MRGRNGYVGHITHQFCVAPRQCSSPEPPGRSRSRIFVTFSVPSSSVTSLFMAHPHTILFSINIRSNRVTCPWHFETRTPIRAQRYASWSWIAFISVGKTIVSYGVQWMNDNDKNGFIRRTGILFLWIWQFWVWIGSAFVPLCIKGEEPVWMPTVLLSSTLSSLPSMHGSMAVRWLWFRVP